jgi:hypothetical protein
MERIRRMINISGKFPVSFSARQPGMAVLLVFLAWGLIACSSVRTFTTQSRPPERHVVVDGRSDDWAGNLFIVKDEGITLGFLNDKGSLYICLRAEGMSTRSQIMMSGLTVWFDPQGGKKKVLGIKFPVGMPPDERLRPRGDFGEDEEEPRSKRPGEESLNELEIIRSDKEEPEKMEVAEAKGIEIKVLPSRAGLVYELKIPFVRSDESPIAVGTEPGKTIGIGFETGKIEFGGMPRGRGGMPGGGMPPMGGGMGRGGMGGMGRMGGRGFEMPKEIKIWATVKLSAGEIREPAEVQSLSHSL